MDEQIDRLVTSLATNFKIHGKAWRKVRRDRVEKLLPDMDFEIVESVVETAITRGLVKPCHKNCDDGMIPAIRLSFQGRTGR
jgi:hypothetical protein